MAPPVFWGAPIRLPCWLSATFCRRASTGTAKQTQAAYDLQSECLAAVLLGLAETPAEVGSMVEVHDRLLEGLPAAAIKRLRDRLQRTRDNPEVMSALGLASLRGKSSMKRLTPPESNTAWTFARILCRATHVLGDQSAAEKWMTQPVMALDRRLPVELLTTIVGTQALDDHLTRMEFGVHT